MRIITFSLIPMAAAIIAAAIASLYKPSSIVRSVTQHIAAGVVVAAVALELGPDLLKRHESISTAVGFSIGVIVLLIIRSLTEKSSENEKPGAQLSAFPLNYVFTIASDLFVDGLMIGIGFAAGAKAGVLMTFALTLELISLGLVLALELLNSACSRWQTIGTVTLLTSLVPIGAGAGILALSRMSDAIVNGTIAAGAAALLYLVTEELLREAHEQPETPLITATFFLGFLAVLLIDMQLG